MGITDLATAAEWTNAGLFGEDAAVYAYEGRLAQIASSHGLKLPGARLPGATVGPQAR